MYSVCAKCHCMFLHFVLTENCCFRELIPRRSSGSISSSSEGDWLDKATINCGGTFLEEEVNEVRSMCKVLVFCVLLIPYWMIYTQVIIMTMMMMMLMMIMMVMMMMIIINCLKSSTDSKVRTTLYSIINSTTHKFRKKNMLLLLPV